MLCGSTATRRRRAGARAGPGGRAAARPPGSHHSRARRASPAAPAGSRPPRPGHRSTRHRAARAWPAPPARSRTGRTPAAAASPSRRPSRRPHRDSYRRDTAHEGAPRARRSPADARPASAPPPHGSTAACPPGAQRTGAPRGSWPGSRGRHRRRCPDRRGRATHRRAPRWPPVPPARHADRPPPSSPRTPGRAYRSIDRRRPGVPRILRRAGGRSACGPCVGSPRWRCQRLFFGGSTSGYC